MIATPPLNSTSRANEEISSAAVFVWSTRTASRARPFFAGGRSTQLWKGARPSQLTVSSV